MNTENIGRGAPIPMAHGVRNKDTGRFKMTFTMNNGAGTRTRAPASQEGPLASLSAPRSTQAGSIETIYSAGPESGTEIGSTSGSDSSSGADSAAETEAVVRIRVARQVLTHRIRISNDTEGASRLKTMLKLFLLIFGRDGYDDFANLLPKLFAEQNRAYIELGLMTPFTLIVVVSMINAINGALETYQEGYPAAVQCSLDQQKQMIDALRTSGASEADLSLLTVLYNKGRHVWMERGTQRKEGMRHVVARNLRAKLNGCEGNGKLSKEFAAKSAKMIEDDVKKQSEIQAMALERTFVDEARDILELCAERKRLQATENLVYQHTVLERLEKHRHLTKKQRTVDLKQAGAMTAMAFGMGGSTASAAASVAATVYENAGNITKQTAVTSAAAAVDVGAGVVFIGGQTLSAASALLAGYNTQQSRNDINKTARSVKKIGDELPPSVGSLHAQNTSFARRANTRQQAANLSIATGQGLMAGSTAGGLGGATIAVTLPLVVPGIIFTVAGAVGKDSNNGHTGTHNGEHALPELKTGRSFGNLGQEIGANGLDTAIMKTANRYKTAQDAMVRVAVCRDILTALGKEDILKNTPPDSGKRYARVAHENHRWRNRSELLPDGVKAMIALRQASYPAAFFDRPLTAIYRDVLNDLWDHPDRPTVVDSRTFQQEVLYETTRKLARLKDPSLRPLFFGKDGKLVKEIADDEDFERLLETSPVAGRIFLKKSCEILANRLYPGDSFARSQNHGAVGDLANTKVRYSELTGKPDINIRL